MARCAARLARPRLAACLSLWISDWDGTQRARQLARLGAEGRSMVEEAVAAEREQCQRLLERARREMEQVQQAHDHAMANAARQRAELLEQQRLELHGSAEEVLAAREARQKQERIEAMYARSLRRMTHGGILRGWETWRAQWAHAARIGRLLARGAARLARPQLAACLGAWVSDWRSWEERSAGMSWDARLRAQKHEAAEERIRLEEVLTLTLTLTLSLTLTLTLSASSSSS